MCLYLVIFFIVDLIFVDILLVRKESNYENQSVD